MENSKSSSENRKLTKRFNRKFGWKTKTMEWIQKKLPNIMNNSAVDITKFFKAEHINYLISKDLFGVDTKSCFYLKNSWDSKDMFSYFNRLNVLIPKVIGCNKYYTEQIGKIIMDFKSQKRIEKENRLKQKSERSSMNISQNSNHCTLSKEQMHSNSALVFPTSTLSVPTSLKNKELISVFCQNQFQFPTKELLPHSVSSVNKQTPIFKLIIKEFNSTCNKFIKKNTVKGNLNEKNKMDEYLLYCLCYIFSLLPYTRIPTDKRHSRDAVLKIMSKLDKNKPCFFERKTYKNFHSITGFKLITDEQNEWEGKGRETDSSVPRNEDNDKVDLKRSDKEVSGKIAKNIELSLLKSQPITEPDFPLLTNDKNKGYSVQKTSERISDAKAEDTDISIHKIDNKDSQTKDQHFSTKTNEGISSEVTVSPDFSIRQFEKLMDTENDKESSSKPGGISNEIVGSPDFSVNRSENITESEISHYTKQEDEKHLQKKTSGKGRDEMSSEFSVHQSENGIDVGYGNSQGKKSDMYSLGKVSGGVPGDMTENPDFSIHQTDKLRETDSKMRKNDKSSHRNVDGETIDELKEDTDLSAPMSTNKMMLLQDDLDMDGFSLTNTYSESQLDNIIYQNINVQNSETSFIRKASPPKPNPITLTKRFSNSRGQRRLSVRRSDVEGSASSDQMGEYVQFQNQIKRPPSNVDMKQFIRNKDLINSEKFIPDRRQSLHKKSQRQSNIEDSNDSKRFVDNEDENLQLKHKQSNQESMKRNNHVASALTRAYRTISISISQVQPVQHHDSEISNDRSVRKAYSDIESGTTSGRNINISISQVQPFDNFSPDMKLNAMSFNRNTYDGAENISEAEDYPSKRQSVRKSIQGYENTNKIRNVSVSISQGQPPGNRFEETQSSPRQSPNRSLQNKDPLNNIRNVSVSLSQQQSTENMFEEGHRNQSVRRSVMQESPPFSTKIINISVSESQPMNVQYEPVTNDSRTQSAKQGTISERDKMLKNKNKDHLEDMEENMATENDEVQSKSSEKRKLNRNIQDPLDFEEVLDSDIGQIKHNGEPKTEEKHSMRNSAKSTDYVRQSIRSVNVSVSQIQIGETERTDMSSFMKKSLQNADDIMRYIKDSSNQETEPQLIKSLHDDFQNKSVSESISNRYSDDYETKRQSSEKSNVPSSKKNVSETNLSKSVNQTAEGSMAKTQSLEKSNVPSSKKNISETSKSLNQIADGSLAKTQSMEKSNVPSSKKKSSNKISQNPVDIEDELESEFEETEYVMDRESTRSYQNRQNSVQNINVSFSQGIPTDNTYNESQQNQPIRNISISISQSQPIENSVIQSNKKTSMKKGAQNSELKDPPNSKLVTNDNEVESNSFDPELFQSDREVSLRKSLRSYENGRNSIRSINVSVTQGPMTDSIYADISHQPSILQNNQEPSRILNQDSNIVVSTGSKPVQTPKKMSINKVIPNPVYLENQSESESGEMEKMFPDTSKNVEKNLNVSLSLGLQTPNADDDIETSSRQDLSTSLFQERQERNKSDIIESKQSNRKSLRDIDNINALENINITVSEPFYMDNVPQTMVIDISLQDDIANKSSIPNKDLLADSGQYMKNKFESEDRTTSVTDNLYRYATSTKSPQTQDQSNVKSVNIQPDSKNDKISSNIAWSDINSSGITSAKEHFERNFQETVAHNEDLGDNMFGVAHDLLKETQMIHQVQLGLLKNVARETDNQKAPIDLTKTESVYYDAEVCSDLENTNSEIPWKSIKINPKDQPYNSENHNESIDYDSSYKDCRSSVQSPYKDGNTSNSSASYITNNFISINQVTETNFNVAIK